MSSVPSLASCETPRDSRTKTRTPVEHVSGSRCLSTSALRVFPPSVFPPSVFIVELPLARESRREKSLRAWWHFLSSLNPTGASSARIAGEGGIPGRPALPAARVNTGRPRPAARSGLN